MSTYCIDPFSCDALKSQLHMAQLEERRQRSDASLQSDVIMHQKMNLFAMAQKYGRVSRVGALPCFRKQWQG